MQYNVLPLNVLMVGIDQLFLLTKVFALRIAMVLVVFPDCLISPILLCLQVPLT